MTALTDSPAAAAVPGTPPAPVKSPRRWLGRNGQWWLLLVGGGLLAIYLTLDAIFSGPFLDFRDLPTTSLLLGSILAATCVFYAMLYRLRQQDGVSIPFLFAAFAVAAFVTTTLAGEANGLTSRIAAETARVTIGGNSVGVSALLFAGPVEETLKGLTVLILGLFLKTKTFRGGMFVGGAVGLGFATVENLEYLTNAFEHPIVPFTQIGMLTFTVAFRTVLTPILHPIFTSLLGGALFATTRNNRYRFSVPLVGTWFAVMGLHSLWDSAGIGVTALRGHVSLAALGGLSLLTFAVLLGMAIGLPFVWRAVAHHADRLAGIRPPKQRYTAPPPPPPTFSPGAPPPPPGYALVS
jgi:RsiW-degrading membrane proteinase PrsW (M82 family)